MLYQGKDGELKLLSGTTKSLTVLFCEMDFTGPTSRPRNDETLMMNRGKFSSDAHYIEGNDEPRYAPVPITFSCRVNDTINTRALIDWISGVTLLAGTTYVESSKGTTTIDGNTLPDFYTGATASSDTVSGVSSKYAYNVEMQWDGTNDICMRYNEVYFKPGEQSITESADGLMLSVSGEVYGDVTRIAGFTAGYSDIG